MRFSAVALTSALGVGIPFSTSATRPSKRRRQRRRNVETATHEPTTVKLQKLATIELSAAEYFLPEDHEKRLSNIPAMSFETCTLSSQSENATIDLDLGIMKGCSSSNDICIIPNMIGYEIASSISTGTDIVGYFGYEGYDGELVVETIYEDEDDMYAHSLIAMGICYPQSSVNEDYLHVRMHAVEDIVEEEEVDDHVNIGDDGYYSAPCYYTYGDRALNTITSFAKRLFGEDSEPHQRLRKSEKLKEDIAKNAITMKESHYLKCQQYCEEYDYIPQIAEWLVDNTSSGPWPIMEELVANCVHAYKYRYYFGIEGFPVKCPFNMSTPMNCWNMTGVDNLQTAFRKQTWFNKPLDCWDTSSVTSVHGMFTNAYSFNQDINMWDVSSVEDFSNMFYFAVEFDQSLNLWDTRSATDASKMFGGANQFDSQIDTWNFSKVQNVHRMFFAAQNFNQPLENWDTSSLTALDRTFVAAFAFNQPLGSWNTTGVTALTGTFMNAYAFDQPLASWDVSNVVNMDYTFLAAVKFDQPLDDKKEYWNVESATSMKQMFYRTSMNQCIGSWAEQLSAHEGVDKMSTHGMFYRAKCPVNVTLGTPPFDQGPWCQNESNKCKTRSAGRLSKTKADKKGIKSTKSSKSLKHHVT